MNGYSLLKSLRSRIRRIAGAEKAVGGLLDRWTPALICLACLCLVSVIVMNWKQSAAHRAWDEHRTTIGTLPGGIEVELIGVGFHPSTMRPWWKPDGGELSEQPTLDGGQTVMGNSPEQAKCREFLIHIRGLPADHSVHTDYGKSSASGSSYSDGLWVGEHAAGPFSSDSTTIRVGLTTEPYGPFVTIAADGQKQTNPNLPAELQSFYDCLVPYGVEDVSGRTELLVKNESLQGFHTKVAWELFAVDVDGQKHRRTSESGFASGERRFGFGLPQQKLARFEYRLRPYRDWVTFENVSLEPGRQTKFQTHAVSPRVLMEDRFTATLPGGIQVAFAGLAPMEADPQLWWRPDGTRMTTIPILGPVQRGLYQSGSSKMCRALIEISGVNDGQAVTGMGGTRNLNHRPSGEPFLTYTGAVEHLPKKPTTSVTIRVATEPISPTRLLNAEGNRLPPAADAPADHIMEDITVLQVSSPPGSGVGQTEVKFQVPRAWWQPDLRMVAIDKQGKRHEQNGTAARIPEDAQETHEGMFYFPLPPAQIERFEYQFRLYRHAVTFENVSLEPGKRTDVKVSTASLTGTMSETSFSQESLESDRRH